MYPINSTRIKLFYSSIVQLSRNRKYFSRKSRLISPLGSEKRTFKCEFSFQDIRVDLREFLNNVCSVSDIKFRHK